MIILVKQNIDQGKLTGKVGKNEKQDKKYQTFQHSETSGQKADAKHYLI